MTQGKHKIQMRPKDDWGMTAGRWSSSWWCHHTTNDTRSLGRREGKTGNLNCKVSGEKGLPKTKQRSFLCFFLMIPVSCTSQREILNQNLSKLRVSVKAYTCRCISVYICHIIPMSKPPCQQYVLTLQKTTFVFSFLSMINSSNLLLPTLPEMRK